MVCMLHKTTHHPLVLLPQHYFLVCKTLGVGGGGVFPLQIISLIGSSEQLISIFATIKIINLYLIMW